MSNEMKILDAYETLKEAIAILQCAEDASKETHVQKVIGIVVGMLLGAVGDISSSRRYESDKEENE